MLNTTQLISYKDVTIQPICISDIDNECYIFKDCSLPIFTAPINTVVNEENFHVFKNNHIIPILPRDIDIRTRLDYANDGIWIAVSLEEFNQYFTKVACNNKMKVFIDFENGHSQQLYDLIDSAKSVSGDKLKIMISNIANPYTYFECCRHKIDYVLVGINNPEIGITCPPAYILNEISRLKPYNNYNYTKIVAGEINNYSDAIKAFALGADYVMIDNLFIRCLESAAPKIYNNNGYELSINISNFKNWKYNKDINGWNCQLIKTCPEDEYLDYEHCFKNINAKSENKLFSVTYKLSQWVKDMSYNLRSIMSYCGISDIRYFNPTTVKCFINKYYV